MKKSRVLVSAKMTSKGQITLPKTVRNRLNLEEGDFIVFYEDENENIKIIKQENCKVVSNNKQSIISEGEKNE